MPEWAPRAGLAPEPADEPCLHSSGGPGQGQGSAQALTSGLMPKPGMGGTSLAAGGQSCWRSLIMLAKAGLFSVGCWSASSVSQEMLPSLGCSRILFLWDWHYSCPQNLLPDKAHGALMQEIVSFFDLFFAVLIVFSAVLFSCSK